MDRQHRCVGSRGQNTVTVLSVTPIIQACHIKDWFPWESSPTCFPPSESKTEHNKELKVSLKCSVVIGGVICLWCVGLISSVNLYAIFTPFWRGDTYWYIKFYSTKEPWNPWKHWALSRFIEIREDIKLGFYTTIPNFIDCDILSMQFCKFCSIILQEWKKGNDSARKRCVMFRCNTFNLF